MTHGRPAVARRLAHCPSRARQQLQDADLRGSAPARPARSSGSEAARLSVSPRLSPLRRRPGRRPQGSRAAASRHRRVSLVSRDGGTGAAAGVSGSGGGGSPRHASGRHGSGGSGSGQLARLTMAVLDEARLSDCEEIYHEVEE